MQLRDKDFWLSNKNLWCYNQIACFDSMQEKMCRVDLQSESSSHYTKFLAINFIQNVKNTFQITLFW